MRVGSRRWCALWTVPFVYILRCADDTFYVGSTRSLDRRLAQHNDGTGAVYTRKRLPVTLVWRKECESVAEAFGLEKRIQGWSRAKRQALIDGDFEALRRHARSTQTRRRLDDGV